MIYETFVNSLLNLDKVSRLIICIIPFFVVLLLIILFTVLTDKQQKNSKKSLAGKIFKSSVALFTLFIGIRINETVGSLEKAYTGDIKVALVMNSLATSKYRSEQLYPNITITKIDKDGNINFSVSNKITENPFQRNSFLTGKFKKEKIREIRYSDSRYLGITKTLQALRNADISFYNFHSELDGTGTGITKDNKYFETAINDEGKVDIVIK